MKKTILFLALTIACCYVACKKENQAVTKTQTTAPQPSKRGNCSPDNSNNSHDYIGAAHNLFVDHLVSNEITELSDMITACITFAGNNNYVLPQNLSQVIQGQSSQMAANLTAMRSNMATFEAGFIQNSYLSQAGKNYLSTLFFTTFNPQNYTSNSEYCDVKANIVNLEAAISQDQQLPQSEKAVLFAALSVARYSAYWNYSHNPNQNIQALMSIDWDVVIADITAYVECCCPNCGNPETTCLINCIIASSIAAQS